jgi:hypothetical protein
MRLPVCTSDQIEAHYEELKMGKLGWPVVVLFCAAVAADQYLNYGYYTDGAMAMFRQIRNSFGW